MKKMQLRKWTSLLLLFALLVPGIWIQAADIPYALNEDFSKLSLNDSWGTAPPAGSFIGVKDRTDKAGDRALYIQDNDDAMTVGVSKNITISSSSVVAEVDMMLEDSSNTTGSVLLYVQDAAGKNAVSIALEKTALKVFNLVDGATKSSVIKSGLKAGTWYNIKVVADFTAKKADIYVDNVAAILASPFRSSEATSFGRLFLAGTSKPSPVNAWIDNVKVYDAKHLDTKLLKTDSAAPSSGGSTLPTTATPGKVTMGSQDYYAYEDFSSFAVDFKPWGGSFPEGSYFGIKPRTDKAEDKALYIVDKDDKTTVGTTKTLSGVKGQLVTEADFMIENASATTMLFYVQDSAGKNAASFAIGKGDLRVFTTEEGKTVSKIINNTLVADKWFNVKAMINCDTKTYDIYLNNDRIGKDISFRNDATEISKLMFSGATSPSPVMCWIDNVKVYDAKYLSVNAPKAEIQTDAVSKIVPMATYAAASQKMKDAIVLFVGNSSAYVGGKSVRIDPENPSVRPVVKDDRTLLPVRFVSENLGATVGFDEATQTVSVTLGSKVITLTLGSTQMSINGQKTQLDVGAQTIGDRTVIPLRALANALGKKVFWDDSGLIVISDLDQFINPATEMPLLERIIDIASTGREVNSFDQYGKVFFSTRFWRDLPDSTLPNSLASLDAQKRFMATDNKWSYIMAKDKVDAITALGGKFQGAVNINTADPDGKYNIGRQELIDGSHFKSPNMTWVTAYGCANAPEYQEIIKNQAIKFIGLGVSAMQFDDPGGNFKGYSFGGCFCQHCMQGFTSYVKDTYSQAQIKEFGIDDIGTFHYKEYLKTKYNITTSPEYLAGRKSVPLDSAFKNFQLLSSRAQLARMRQVLTDNSPSYIEFSYNNYEFLMQFADKTHEGKYAHDLFDYGIAEHTDEAYSFENAITGGTFATSLKKPQIVSPVPRSLAKGRQGLAACYALGQYFLVPYDIYVPLRPRYFASVDEYGDMFHFIRQNPQLFNGYEIPSQVGILTNWDVMDRKALTLMSMKLSAAGVPFKDIVASSNMPTFAIDPNDLKGLKYLISVNPPETFTEKDRATIENSGVRIITPDRVDEIIGEVSFISVEADKNVYGIVRAMPGDEAAPKIVHIISRTGKQESDVLVHLQAEKFFGNTPCEATYYRPGYNPQNLPITNNTVTLPALDEWGIIKIYEKSFGNNDILGGGWQFMNIGSPLAYGTATVDGATAQITSSGVGANSATQGDKGSSDQGAFLYTMNKGDTIDGFDISCRIDSISGDAGSAGMMLRANPASNAPFIQVKYQKGTGVVLQVRSDYDLKTITTPLKDLPLPVYVKVSRQAGTYRIYASSVANEFGEPLTELSLDNMKFAGIFTASGKQWEKSSAQVSDLSIVQKEYASITPIDSILATAEKATLKVGDNVKIKVSAKIGEKTYSLQDSSISLQSDAPEIVAVRGKTLEALSNGKASITVKADVGGKAFSQVCVLTVSDSSTLFEENFDGFTPEAILPNWSFNNNAIRPIKSGDGYILRVTAFNKGETSDATATFEASGGKMVFEFDYRGEFGVNDNDSGSRVIYAGNQNVCIICNGKEFIYFFGSEQKAIAPMTQGKWYKFKVVANMSTETADVYIDGAKVVEGGAFRKATDSMSSAQFGGYRVNTDTFHDWDNIKIYVAE